MLPMLKSGYIIMRKRGLLSQPHMKAKLLGIGLIITGVVFLTQQTELFLKLGFGCILIGLFTMVMITERTVPENISNAQIQGHTNAVQQLTKQLDLKGNAVFLPQNAIRSEERLFIPLKNKQIALPEIDNDFVFATGSDGTSLGVALPPSGLSLLHEVEKDTSFVNTEISHLEEKLQRFVAMNILKSVSLKEKQKRWQLDLEKPLYCTNDTSFCKQYPCPTCSAVLTAITKAVNKTIQIEDAEQKGKKTTFYFSVMR